MCKTPFLHFRSASSTQDLFDAMSNLFDAVSNLFDAVSNIDACPIIQLADLKLVLQT